MSFEGRTTEDLIRIAAAGGGFLLHAAGRTTEDLIRISSAAKASGDHVTLAGLTGRTTEDLIRIGAAGRGFVILEG